MSITFLLAFEWSGKMLKGLQVEALRSGLRERELDWYTLVAYSSYCTPTA